jgi:hypothetical protein
MHTQELEPATREFYSRSLMQLEEAGVPYLVGGAYSLACYTGIERHTKDLDVFLRRADCARAMDALAAIGCSTDMTFPHWLAKARDGEDFIDLIFSSGNSIAVVDDDWFTHARESVVFGVPVSICPPEETVWSKAFIMERERYDGADIAHVLRACGSTLDWTRLLRRFGPHWRVLFSHLVLFGFIYPQERSTIPGVVMDYMIGKLQDDARSEAPQERRCHGTLISRGQYLIDIDRWGYEDARLFPPATMSKADIAHWTAGIDNAE